MNTTIRGRLGGAALATAALGATALLLTGCSGGGEVNGGTTAGGVSATTSAAATSMSSPPPAASTAPVTAGGSGSGGTGTGSDPARCTAGELRLSLGAPEGAAGSVYRNLIFTNTGSRPCELTGFPGVSYVAGDDGHQVGPAAEMSGPRGGQVTMAPGGTSVAGLQLVQVANFDASVCHPTPVRGLRVYPPGETASLFVPMDGTGCAGTPPGPQLTVKTVTPVRA